MPDFTHGSAIARSKLFDEFEIFASEIEPEFDTYFESIGSSIIADGAVGFGGAERARPLTFLRFIVRALNWSSIAAVCVLLLPQPASKDRR